MVLMAAAAVTVEPTPSADTSEVPWMADSSRQLDVPVWVKLTLPSRPNQPVGVSKQRSVTSSDIPYGKSSVIALVPRLGSCPSVLVMVTLMVPHAVVPCPSLQASKLSIMKSPFEEAVSSFVDTVSVTAPPPAHAFLAVPYAPVNAAPAS